MAKLAPHRNVIAFHDSGKVSGREYAVLQYVEGLNLREMNVREDSMLEEIVYRRATEPLQQIRQQPRSFQLFVDPFGLPEGVK